jgi:ATP-binding protein involved in chromosome partitioning
MSTRLPYLGSIPLEAEVRKGGDSGQPIVVAYPDSDAAKAIRAIARDVAARVSVLTLQVQADNIIPITMIG